MGVPSVYRSVSLAVSGQGRATARPITSTDPEGGAFSKGFVSLEDRCSNFWTGALRSRTRNTSVIFLVGAVAGMTNISLVTCLPHPVTHGPAMPSTEDTLALTDQAPPPIEIS